MQYQEAVTEARRLVRRSEEDQWRLAQLTWEQVESGVPKKQWARDIEVSPRHVRTLHSVWARWGELAPPSRPRFSEAYQRVHDARIEDDEEELWSAKHREQARSAVRNMPPEQKADVARELLGDERVRRGVFADPMVSQSVMRDTHSRAALTEAGMTVDRGREERARGDYELRHGQELRNEQWARAGVHLDRARNLIIEAGEMASDLPEHRRDSLLAQAQAVQAALDWFRVHVKGSDARLEAELRALIEGNAP